MRVTLALLSRYPALAGMNLDDLVRAQATWKREQTAGLSEYFVGRGGRPSPSGSTSGRWGDDGPT